MSQVMVTPELVAESAADLANIGHALEVAHLVAAAPTVAVVPAAADEVSASIAQLFSTQAEEYQALAGQAAAYHEVFVQRLTASAGAYASAEATNAALLQPFTTMVDSFVNFEAAVRGQVEIQKMANATAVSNVMQPITTSISTVMQPITTAITGFLTMLILLPIGLPFLALWIFNPGFRALVNGRG